MAKSPAKLSLGCPHCGFKQMEHAAAKSALRRQCGRPFVIAEPQGAELLPQTGASLVKPDRAASGEVLYPHGLPATSQC